MTEPTKCPCCGAAVSSMSVPSTTVFQCGSYSENGAPTARSGRCVVNELATLQHFVRDVRANPGDVLSLLERLTEVTG